MNLEHHVIPDSKKTIKDSGTCVKKLPLAKDGTICVLSWVIISIDWNIAIMFKSMSSYGYLKKLNDHILKIRGEQFIILNIKESSIYLKFLIYTVKLCKKY